MKLVWSLEKASKAYIETVKSCRIFRESGVAELVSAMAAGWNAQLIVETWSEGGMIATSVGLGVARDHTCGRHVCVVPDERSRSEYEERMGEAGMWPEIVVGEAEEVMEGLAGIKNSIRVRGHFRPLQHLPYRCRFNPRYLALKLDCTAHSVLYDLSDNTLCPLTLCTDAWCSSGGFNVSK